MSTPLPGSFDVLQAMDTQCLRQLVAALSGAIEAADDDKLDAQRKYDAILGDLQGSLSNRTLAELRQLIPSPYRCQECLAARDGFDWRLLRDAAVDVLAGR